MAELNSTNNAVWIPTEIIANQTLGALGAYLNLGRTVTKDSELVTQALGTTISVPKRGAVTSNSLAENGSVNVQSTTGTDVQVVLDHHQEVTISELDYTRSLQPGSVLPGYLEDGILALAEDIETLLAGLWSGAAFNNDAASGGVAATILDDFVGMQKGLFDRRVPVLAKRYAYVSTGVHAAAQKASAFIDPKLIPNNNVLTEGSVGRISGFDVFAGQLVVKSGSPGVYRNLFYTKNAMVLATRPQPLPEPGLGAVGSNVVDGNGIAMQVVKSYNSTKLANQFTVHVVFGAAVLDNRQLGCLDSTV
jgi:hypothetical protein